MPPFAQRFAPPTHGAHFGQSSSGTPTEVSHGLANSTVPSASFCNERDACRLLVASPSVPLTSKWARLGTKRLENLGNSLIFGCDLRKVCGKWNL